MKTISYITILLLSALTITLVLHDKEKARFSEDVSIEPTIKIEGDEEYRKQVKSCLNLLASKAKEEYALVQSHIGVISQNSKSGMLPWEDPPRFQLNDTTAFYSLTWCASSIAHDAYHSFLYTKYSPNNGEYPPYNKWAGFSAEKEAINFQLRVMKKIGASPREIRYSKSQDGTHGDVNNDGKVTHEDYEQRVW